VEHNKFQFEEVHDVDVHGLRFRMTLGGAQPTVETEQRIRGLREPQTECLLKTLIRSGDRVLEGGACYGYFTMMLSQLVGDGHVYAYEPDRKYYDLVERNVKINNTKNVSLYREFMGGGHIEGEEALESSRVMGDEVFGEFDEGIDVVFLDIEGHELFFVEEMLQADHTPRVLMFQPHVAFYRDRGQLPMYTSLLDAMAEKYHVIATHGMIVGISKKSDQKVGAHSLLAGYGRNFEKVVVEESEPEVEDFKRGRMIKGKRAGHLGGNIAGGDPKGLELTVARWLVRKYEIKTVLDVGCGEGNMVRFFNEYGCQAVGLDGLKRNTKRVGAPAIIHDLTLAPCRVSGIDLVWCVEVAEHIHEMYVDNFLATLANGHFIVMSFADKKQRGHHHVNKQSKEYWIEKARGIGYKYLRRESTKMRGLASGFLKKNSLLFVRDKAAGK